jgi:hypothetical protein
MINPTETTVPVETPASAEMHIDEESRPHFPPSTETVPSYFILSANQGLVKVSDTKDNHPPAQDDAPPQQLD